MAKNKYEIQGEEARRQGKPQSSNPYSKWFPSPAEERAKDDWNIGWKRENNRRKARARSR